MAGSCPHHAFRTGNHAGTETDADLPATEELEVSGFTDAELRAYDKFWDSVSVERTLLDDILRDFDEFIGFFDTKPE